MSEAAAAAGTWRLGEREVNRMGFGTMRLTADPDRERALAVLHRAAELGVDHFDTAAFYVSPGGVLEVDGGPTRHAAELLRSALSPYDGVLVATKVGVAATTDSELRAQVEENLDLLGVDRLELVNLRILQKPGADSVAGRFEALARMQQEGLIGQLGLSNVRVDHVEEAMRIAPVVCVQNGYALDWRRDHDDLVGWCRENHIAFVPYFAMAGSNREAGAEPVRDAAVLAVAEANGVTPQQVRLAWTLHRGPHVLAIPGTGDLGHLEQNVAAAALRLSQDDLDRLEQGRS